MLTILDKSYFIRNHNNKISIFAVFSPNFFILIYLFKKKCLYLSIFQSSSYYLHFHLL